MIIPIDGWMTIWFTQRLIVETLSSSLVLEEVREGNLAYEKKYFEAKIAYSTVD